MLSMFMYMLVIPLEVIRYVCGVSCTCVMCVVSQVYVYSAPGPGVCYVVIASGVLCLKLLHATQLYV